MQLEIERQQRERENQSRSAQIRMTGNPGGGTSEKCRQRPIEKTRPSELHECGMVSHGNGPEAGPWQKCCAWVATVAGPLALAGVLAVAPLGACGGRKGAVKVKLPPPIKNPRFGWNQVGVASWYGHPYHGRKTSNGETYDMNKMTAAHKRLPFDTWLRVENLKNGRATQVRINDRGPFVGKRIIDLSRAAASDIGLMDPGTARVRLTVIRPPRGKPRGSGRRGRGTQPTEARTGARFDIQIGAFAKRSNATSLASKASRRGHSVQIYPFRQGGDERYRVVVSGGSRNQAENRLNVLKRQGFKGFLTRRQSR